MEDKLNNEFHDVKYEPVYLKRPNGSIMTAFRVVECKKNEKYQSEKDNKK